MPLFSLFCNKVATNLWKVVALSSGVAATSQKFFRSCQFCLEVEHLRVKIAFWKCSFNLERNHDYERMEEFPSQEGDRVGAGYPHVERVKVTATPGRGVVSG